MPFPTALRVVYKKNPLDRVICQLRFPPILRIDSEIPSAFQDAIRDNFPLYSEKHEVQQEIALGLGAEQARIAIQQLAGSGSVKNHEFSSEDRSATINLTRTFLAITVTTYTRWESFMDLFRPAISALQEGYRPQFYTRTGLRYIDVFNRSVLGLSNRPWSELLNRKLLGLLSDEIASKVIGFENTYEVCLEEGDSKVRLSTSFVQSLVDHETCFRLDSDFFFPSRVAPDDLNSRLDFLHKQSTNLIQWAVSEDLNNALMPEEV